MKPLSIIAFVLALASIPLRVPAAVIGDAAPPFSIERWIKGSPSVLAQRTNILVVEFWATWCSPCKKAIPHLTELQKKYASKGVVFIGISDEPVDTVATFVAGQGNNMGYHVATDSSKQTYKAWMKAFGENGIPHAFIVRNGIVVWHDYPNASLERTIESLLAGTYDVEVARNFEAGDRLVQHYTKLVQKANATTNAAPVGERILTEFSRDWRVPYRLASAILTDPQVRSRDVALALRAANKATEMTGERSYQSLEVRARALFASGEKQQAVATLKQSIAICNDSEDLPELKKLLTMFERGAQTAATSR